MILHLCGKKELDMFLAALVVKDMDKKIWNHVNNYGENSCMLSVYVEGVFFFWLDFVSFYVVFPSFCLNFYSINIMHFGICMWDSIISMIP